ncbi:unnamed protein product [Linum trigynum]|uniref:Uncharacterized protein n=1 Tax=Linum trigynum TaxID=586398 RepID=A0AAV2G3L7_9ROSI
MKRAEGEEMYSSGGRGEIIKMESKGSVGPKGMTKQAQRTVFVSPKDMKVSPINKSKARKEGSEEEGENIARSGSKLASVHGEGKLDKT